MKSSLSVEEFLAAITTNATQDITKIKKEDLLAICSSFVVLDEEMNVFRFAHLSVMEFLLGLNEYTAVTAHALAAETCLITCSNHCGVLGSSQELTHPLQCYAVLFWAYHCQEAGDRRPQNLIQAFLKHVPENSNSPFLIWERDLRAFLRNRGNHYFSMSLYDVFTLQDMLSHPPDPLFAACTWGFPDVVRDRLKSRDGAKAQKWRWKGKSQSQLLEKINEDNLTCFLVACKYGQNNIVQLLLGQGANINQTSRDSRDYTGLHLAASHRHDCMVALLLDNGIRTDLQHRYGQTILSHAANYNLESSARLLIERGINTQIEEAIHTAALCGHDRILRYLLDSDTRTPSKKRHAELNALCSASCFGEESTIQLLLQRGADVNGHDADGRSPLHHALSHPSRSPLHHALSHRRRIYSEGYKDAMSALLNAGADLEARDRDGATPLHLAINGAPVDVVKILLDKGANLAAKTNRGQTPMDLVLDDDHYRRRIVKFLILIEYASDIEAKAKLREMAETIGVADFNTPDKVSSCLDWLVDRYRKGAPYQIEYREFAWWLRNYYRGRDEDTTKSETYQHESSKIWWQVERERNHRSQYESRIRC